MREYYDHYGVEWDVNTIEEMISGLENWDIVLNDKVIGAMRLAFDGQECYLRDLQIDTSFQNRGIGAAALNQCERLAKEAGATMLKLRVFVISPAIHLYERFGFSIDKQEDNFYYMIKPVL